MAAEIKGVFKPSLQELILASKILVVGAGGIGCEVLKNLVMSGFKDIEIVSKKTSSQLSKVTTTIFLYLLLDWFGHNRCLKFKSSISLSQGTCWQVKSNSCKGNSSEIQPKCWNQGISRQYFQHGLWSWLLPALQHGIKCLG